MVKNWSLTCRIVLVCDMQITQGTSIKMNIATLIFIQLPATHVHSGVAIGNLHRAEITPLSMGLVVILYLQTLAPE